MASKLLNIMTMMLKEIETRLQSASGSHERSYRVTQGRVESLAAEIERERKERRLERPAAMTEGALELADGMRNLVGSIGLVDLLNTLRESPMDGTIRPKGQVAGRDIFIGVEDTVLGLQEESSPVFSTHYFSPRSVESNSRFLSLTDRIDLMLD